MNPCRGKSGEIICDHANLPYCRQTCDIYKQHEKERLEQTKEREKEIENDVEQYFNAKKYRTRAKFIKKKKEKMRK